MNMKEIRNIYFVVKLLNDMVFNNSNITIILLLRQYPLKSDPWHRYTPPPLCIFRLIQ